MDLLERTGPLDDLAKAWAVARAGGAMALVGGEAGIGKTSLIEAFAATLPRGTRVAWGRCEPVGVPKPLAPVLEVAAELTAGGAALFSGEGPPQDRFPDLVQALRRSGPALVVIEDAHWADQATLDFVRYAGRRIDGLGKLLTVTFRSDELDAAGLRNVLATLATTRNVSRIDLQPLSAEAIERLASGRPLDPVLLHARSGGNPFYVRELLRGGPTDVPAAVEDLIAGRLAGLKPSSRDLVGVLAIAGRAGPALLQRLSATATADLEAAISAGLVRTRGGEAVFGHELTREAVVKTLSPTRLLQGHGRVLQALRELRDADPARIAHHALAAGDGAASREAAPKAAKQAMALGAPRQAWTLLRQVLPHFGEAQLRERAERLMDFASACVAVGEIESAVETLDEALEAWRKLKDVRGEGACLTALAIPLVRAGRNAAADERAQAAIKVLEPLGGTTELAAALRVQAHVRMLDRDKALALHYGRRAIRTARDLGESTILAEAHMTVGTALLVADDLEGRSHVARAQAMARSSRNHQLLALACSNAGSASAEQFRFERARSDLEEGLAIAAAHDLDGDAHYMRAWLALIQLYEGALSSAVEDARRLLDGGRLATITRIMALVALGRGSARLGAPGAGAALEEALELAGQTGTLQRLAPVRLARAEAAWLDGDEERAKAEADAVWRLAVGHRHQWHGGETAYWRALGGEVSPPPPWIARPFALELSGQWSEAADEWAQRGCPFEQARALSNGGPEAARAAIQLFDSIDGAPAADALRRRLRRGGIRQVPRGPRPATRQSRWGLTAREQQIADLVSAGLTNESIAHRLQISPKTVETHVSAVLGKLSVSTRLEASRLLAESGGREVRHD